MSKTVTATLPLQRWQGDRGTYHLVTFTGETQWRTSVFPQRKSSEWILLVSKKVMRAEDIGVDDRVEVSLAL